MKKMTTLLLAFAITVASAFAEPESANGLYKKQYDFRDFSSLSVSHAFRVELVIANRFDVEVEVPAYLEPYLQVTQSGEKVRIALERLPAEIQRKLNNNSGKLRARVSTPRLHTLQLSGASTLTASGKQVLGDETLRLQLSGASKLTWPNLEGRNQISLQLSGASKADVDAAFPKTLVNLSGASKLRFNGNAEKLSVECSGASDAWLDGNFDTVDADLSGSSKLTISGDLSQLTLEQSGVSRFEAEGKTRQANVELSGVSKCHLTILEQLQYELSGVSSLVVKDLGAAIKGNNSRGSKFNAIR